MAEVTVYHGTSGDVAELIRRVGLKRPPGGDGPFVTLSKELALGFAWSATAARPTGSGGGAYTAR